MNSLWKFPTSSSRKLIPFLIISGIVFNGLLFYSEFEFPWTGSLGYSLIQGFLVLAMFIALIITITRAYANYKAGSPDTYLWIVAIASLSIILFIKLSDNLEDYITNNGYSIFDGISIIANSAVTVFVFGVLVYLRKLDDKPIWIYRALHAIIIFQIISIFSEFLESGKLFNHSEIYENLYMFVKFLEVFCIEFYIVSLAFFRKSKFLSPNPIRSGHEINKSAKGLFIGSNARMVFEDCDLYKSPNYPPVPIAFYPFFREITLYVVITLLLSTAGRDLKRATGKSLSRQFREMSRLWFRDGIDPSSYYAQDFYDEAHRDDAPHYLTRFETKNGLFNALNSRLPQPIAGNEMKNKDLFARECARAGIPHPQSLISAKDGELDWEGNVQDLERDLFCKPQFGRGAKGTLTFRHTGPGQYRDRDNVPFSRDAVLELLKATSLKTPMLVQPWLRNHESIADLALESLLAIRVITCLNSAGKPEVTMAMLRLLSKLEPAWTELPDGEYAAPINLETGELGLFTGDNPRTAHLRYQRHPITDKRIEGRILAHWTDISAVAVAAHAAFAHRIVVGWDIALTQDGPIVLEGNSNFDVMFLQRVADRPIGRTHLGTLLNFHLNALYQDRLGKSVSVSASLPAAA